MDPRDHPHVQRAEAKRHLTQELGAKIESLKEKRRAEDLTDKQVIKNLNELGQFVDKHKRWWGKELKEDKCTENERDVANKVIDQVCGIIRNRIESVRKRRNAVDGYMNACEDILDICERIFKEEGTRGSRIVAYLNSLELGEDPGGRPPGIHPGNPIASMKDDDA